jgi:hypothetical protein
MSARELAPPRLADWDKRLHDFIEAHQDVVFSWGVKDCALFGADLVLALTGADFGAAFRGQYDSREGAAAALRAYGAGTITRTFDQHLQRCIPAMARRGDLAMADNNIGVVMGDFALFIGEEDGVPGLVRIPRAGWHRCWKV